MNGPQRPVFFTPWAPGWFRFGAFGVVRIGVKRDELKDVVRFTLWMIGLFVLFYVGLAAFDLSRNRHSDLAPWIGPRSDSTSAHS